MHHKGLWVYNLQLDVTRISIYEKCSMELVIKGMKTTENSEEPDTQ